MGQHPGISVRKLADKLGVSVATVSRALNNHPEVSRETRSRVLEMADRTGYVPRVGQRMANVLGLVYQRDPIRATMSSFDAAIISGILDGLDELKFDVTIINVERDMAPGETYTQFFRRKGVRGVIIRNTEPGSDFAERIAEENFPAVLIADRSDDPRVNYIYTDSRTPSVRAVEHLVHLGHRRIALGAHVYMDSDHRDRRDGYLEGLRRHGIEPDEDLILTAPASMEGGVAITSRLLALDEPPTAIYLTDPLSTVGALHTCMELGIRVPQDISIVGFDDSDINQVTFLHYTAICQNAPMLGREAARWITHNLTGMTSAPLREAVPGSLAIKQTTGVAPAHPVRLGSDGRVVR